jgi:uncharacterized membrane protein
MLTAVLILAALGSALMGGIFFAFSSFAMRGLMQLPPAQGIAAMQRMNITVINPIFLTVFLGTAVLSALLIGIAFWQQSNPHAWLITAGGVTHFIGSFLVTMLCNVPRNNHLAVMASETASAAEYWARYVPEWLRWNHVRTIASLLAAVLFMLSLR